MRDSIHRDLTFLLAILSFWLAVGWFFYPIGIEDLGRKIGEDEVKGRVLGGYLPYVFLGVAFFLLSFWRKTQQSEIIGEPKMKSYPCPHCGKKLSPDEKICPSCRAPIP